MVAKYNRAGCCFRYGACSALDPADALGYEHSHWGGWIIGTVDGEGKIYFAGDSGYFRGFKMIGKAYAIDTALLPIGAYDTEWFMQMSHMTPEEAVQCYLELGARRFIPMHYGAFRLADDTTKEALDRLVKEWERQGLCEEELQIMKLGETFLI